MAKYVKFIFLIVSMLFVFAPELFAQEVDIPLAEKIADDTEDMGVFELGKYLVFGVAGLIFAGLSLYALSTTGNAALQSFNEWRTGRIEFADMASKVGLALVVMVVVLLLAYLGYQVVESNA